MSARVIALGQRAAGDDGVGPAILDRLRAAVARDVELVELAEASAVIPLLASPLPVVIVDAVMVDSGTEGDLVELDAAVLPRGVRPVSTHGLDLGRAVALARMLAAAGTLAPSIRFIGVTITRASPWVVGLSPRIQTAIPAAVARILALLAAAALAG